MSATLAFSALTLLPRQAKSQDNVEADTAASSDDAPEESPSDSGGGPGFGVYVDVDGAGLFALSSTHEWGKDCPAVNTGAENWEPECSTNAPIGLLLQGRLGLRFGYLGIEGFGLTAIDWSNAQFDQEIPGLPSSASKMGVGRVGGGLGAGLRLMTAPGLFRIGAGAGGGVMFRHVYTTISSLDGASEGYQSPFLSFDLTVTLLSLVNVGVMGLVEFPGDVSVSPDFSGIDDGMLGQELESQIGNVTVFSGPQFFIGPKVGIHFGG